MAQGEPVSKKRKREKTVLEHVSNTDGDSKFARALASPDFVTRSQGLQALSKWLGSKDEVSQEDMQKIWKGLFYCFWHSDKAPYQAELSKELASLQQSFKTETAFKYFTEFLLTMRREWRGIDRLRLDKFLLLIRNFTSEMFAKLKKSNWKESLVKRYTDFLVSSLFVPSDNIQALGIIYHVFDLYIPELVKVCDDGPVPSSSALLLIEPLVKAAVVLEESGIRRIKDSVFDVILEFSDGDDKAAALSKLNFANLSALIVEVAEQPGVLRRNRLALKALARTFSMLAESQAESAKLKELKKKKKRGGDGKAEEKEEVEDEKEEAEKAPVKKLKKMEEHSGQERLEKEKEEAEKAPVKKLKKMEEHLGQERLEKEKEEAEKAPVKKLKKMEEHLVRERLEKEKEEQDRFLLGAQLSAKKKRVVISETSNLHFEVGAPLPDPFLRTPPASRPKGSSLKKPRSTLGLTEFGTPQRKPSEQRRLLQTPPGSAATTPVPAAKTQAKTPVRTPVKMTTPKGAPSSAVKGTPRSTRQ